MEATCRTRPKGPKVTSAPKKRPIRGSLKVGSLLLSDPAGGNRSIVGGDMDGDHGRITSDGEC